MFQQFLVCQENVRNSKIYWCFLCLNDKLLCLRELVYSSHMKIGMISFWYFNWLSMLTILELISFLNWNHVTSFCKQGPLMRINSDLVIWIYWIWLSEMSFSLCTYIFGSLGTYKDCYVIYSPKFEFNVSLFFSLHDGMIICFMKPMFFYHF